MLPMTKKLIIWISSNIASDLNLKPNIISNSETLSDIIQTFENNQSVQKSEIAITDENKTFAFSHVTEEEIRNEILNLFYKKSTGKGDIPAKNLKDSINVYSKEITTIISSYFLIDWK